MVNISRGRACNMSQLTLSHDCCAHTWNIKNTVLYLFYNPLLYSSFIFDYAFHLKIQFAS